MPQQVVSKEFYHISNADDSAWQIGKVLHLGNSYNRYWIDCKSANGLLVPGTTEILSPFLVAQEVIAVLGGDNNAKTTPLKMFYHYDPFLTLKAITPLFKKNLIQVRELIYEQIRATEFPDCPSRQKASWLIPVNLEAIMYWVKTILRPGRSLLKVRATGTVHQTNDETLVLHMRDLDDWAKQSRCYWKGVTSDKPNDELLFIGQIDIIDAIPMKWNSQGKCELSFNDNPGFINQFLALKTNGSP